MALDIVEDDRSPRQNNYAYPFVLKALSFVFVSEVLVIYGFDFE